VDVILTPAAEKFITPLTFHPSPGGTLIQMQIYGR